MPYVVVTDENFTIRGVSAPVAELLGCTVSDLLGHYTTEISSRDVETRKQRYQREIDATGIHRRITFLRRRDGLEVIVEAITRTVLTAGAPMFVTTLTPLSGDSGDPLMTRDQVAEYAKVHVSTIDRARQRGELRSAR